MQLTIIIVNWNSGDLLHNCVSSLLDSSYSDYMCYIIDNDSSDDSFKKVREKYYDKRLVYIKNECNIGFGRACNSVLSLIKSEYVLLLNPDTLLNKYSLANAIGFIDEHQNIDVLGIQNITKDNSILRTCSRFPNTLRLINDIVGLSKVMPGIFKPATIMTDWDHCDSRFIDHVSGAFYLVRFKILSLTGFFDERFFLYMEDLDLSKRIIERGGRIFFNADYKIIHEGGGTSKKIPATRLYYSLQSRFLFCEKYKNEISAGFILAISLLLEPLVRIAGSLIFLKFNEVPVIFKSYRLFFIWLIRKKKN